MMIIEWIKKSDGVDPDADILDSDDDDEIISTIDIR